MKKNLARLYLALVVTALVIGSTVFLYHLIDQAFFSSLTSADTGETERARAVLATLGALALFFGALHALSILYPDDPPNID